MKNCMIVWHIVYSSYAVAKCKMRNLCLVCMIAMLDRCDDHIDVMIM